MSKIEVNTVEPQCGTTLTLGGSGDTVTLGSGASQSGFGRTGTVDWQTTVKTTTFTAVNGEGYFVNTTSGAVTVNLPAGSVGAIVSIKDYAQTFDTANCTVSANGSEKIENLTTDLILDTEGVAVTLVYADATRGWQAVNSNEVTNVVKFVTATGGTETIVCTNFKVHTFTGPGTFNVSCAGSPTGSTQVDYLVIGGGGSGGNAKDGLNGAAGGAGAGGYRESGGTASGCYTVSPLGSSPSPVAAITVSAQNYPITVGAGGANRSTDGIGSAGSPSTFDSITSAGGGAGGRGSAGPLLAGGSGGGSSCCGTAGAGNTPPVSPPQGNPGGNVHNPGTPTTTSAGGGGATAAGGNGAPGGPAGPGGAGATSSINGTPTARAGGGGGGGNNGETGGGSGGSGGGGAGGNFPLNPGTAGTANTGGGGGASASGPGSATSGAGGSGIVIIRYKFQ